MKRGVKPKQFSQEQIDTVMSYWASSIPKKYIGVLTGLSEYYVSKIIKENLGIKHEEEESK